MYLKSITIQGFKSFANKIVFEFHDGITGIVGPNGSGKSNVADAVRWVLGEQSAKQLRGAKMEDVIFSGTEIRKPLGFAYVAITMDNADHKLPVAYHEVTIARRVYRSGESEYSINGSSCRLRDVHELFLDTGIGKEGYSIIGQGQIDKILSGKPEERRELFDEAAGIVKFKKRKAEAQKNLEEEKQNLIRIDDILSELEKQTGPLQKQSEIAREYLKLKEELKTSEVNLFLAEYSSIKENEEKLKEKVSIAENDLKNAKKEYDSTKEEYERLEKEIEACNNDLEQKKNGWNRYKLEKEQCEGNIKVLEEQIATAGQNDLHLKKQLEEIRSEITGKENEQQEYASRQEQNKEEKEKLLIKKTAEEKSRGNVKEKIETYRKEIENCNSEIYRYFNESTGIKTKMQRYETMLEQSHTKQAELNRKIIESKSKEEQLRKESDAQKESLAKISEKIEKIREENDKIASDRKKGMERIACLKRSRMELQQSYLREKSKLDSLKNMAERYEGYGNSIKKVMEQKEKTKGIIGVVADIMKVEKQYETAVETALGGSIQNIVTEDEETAKELIQFLKVNRYGRATFLPLTNVGAKGGIRNQEVLKEKGVIGTANSLIHAEEKFSGLMNYLLGRIIVTDHIDSAALIAKKYGYSLKIVTLEGELLNPGGSISGGAYRNSSNLLGRHREINELKKKITIDKENLDSILSELEQTKQSGVRYEHLLESNKKQLQQLFLEQNTMKMNLNQTEEMKAATFRKSEDTQKELAELSLQKEELKKKIRELADELKENEEKSTNNEQRLKEWSSLLEQENQKESEQAEKEASVKMQLASLEQQETFLLENRRRIKAELDKLWKEKQDVQKKIEESLQHLEERKKRLEEEKSLLDEYEEKIQKAGEETDQIAKHKEHITKNHKLFFDKRDQLFEQISLLDKEVFRLNSQIEKLSEQMDQKINYMWDEYELTYQKALMLRREIGSQQQIKKTAENLKVKIKALGEVNVNAIEEHKKITERYELLKSQRDDLVKAEEALRNIIEELDREMRKQFSEKFGEIKTQFDLVFKELFGGGKGTLKLVEGEDILEAGIGIIAQPPGKKLQNMMQLSGGEKALTAISLLFAIQNLKPSPFCLLDEIEAALDDSNVKRYAKYLHKLTKHTQFIVITHRRGTMAAADILYGITMQEKGVSTLVSVNLIENELEE